MIASFFIQTLNGLASASLLFLVALGLTLIFGVTRVVNFAHGSFYMLGAYIAVTAGQRLGGGAMGFWGGVLTAAVAVGAIGVVIEATILRRIYRAPELLQLMATFGLVLVIKDAVLYLWGPEDILGPRAPGFEGAVRVLGKPLPEFDLVLLALGPLALLATWQLLTRTTWGTRIRAATEDRDMAAALGINQRLLFTSVFGLGSALAGLSGALALPREPANLGMDLHIVADVFVVAVVGGLGSIPGAYLAAVIISVVKTWCIGLGDIRIAGIPVPFTKLTLVAEFIVMAVVLIVRPWGLLGRPPPTQRIAPEAVVAMPQPTRRFWQATPFFAAGLLIFAGIADRFTVVLATDMVVLALFAMSLGLLMGWAGLATFGHAAYFGTGAYGAAIAAKAGLGLPVSIVSGMMAAAALATLLGWFCVRLAGVSLAMLSLAFAQIVWAIVFQWDAVTGGSNGLVGIWPPALLADKRVFFLFALLLAGGAILLTFRLAHTPFGYALRAQRDSQRRAEAIGIDVRRLRWIAFVVSGTLAGLAGAVFAFSKGSLSPDTLSIPRSVDALVMVLLGGVQTLVGPVLGAIALTGLQDWVTRVFPYWQAVLGLLVIFLTVAFPQGIAGGWTGRRRAASSVRAAS